MFFSSTPSPAILSEIRQVPGLVARLKTLKSVRRMHRYRTVTRCFCLQARLLHNRPVTRGTLGEGHSAF